MQRPGPLPPAPQASGRPRTAASAAPAESDEPDVTVEGGIRAPEPVDRHGETAPIADEVRDAVVAASTSSVAPMAPPIALPGMGADAAPASADASDAAEERELSFRDVLKAARARRKALRAEVRRFTVRQRRRRTVWIAAVGTIVLLAAGTVAAVYSPLFAVEQIGVAGTSALDAGDVQKALDGQLGTPLALVDESAVKAALVTFPLVESYTLEARPPHELVVRIVERTPVGVVETPAGFTVVDAAGVALSTTATEPSGYPLLTVDDGTDSAAFRALGQVMRTIPDDIRAQVTAASASTPDDVTLALGGSNASIVWGSAEDSAKKALVLAKIMALRPPAGVSSYDVSSPDAVVVR